MKTLIKRVRVFDGTASQLAGERQIVIQDNLVREITASQVSEEGFDQVIDGEGKTAMPTFTWDAFSLPPISWIMRLPAPQRWRKSCSIRESQQCVTRGAWFRA